MFKYLGIAVVISVFMINTAMASNLQINPNAKSFKYSTTVEKERPELDDVTKALIAKYRQSPTEANRQALKRQIEINYDNVVARKKAKLAELRATAKDQSKITEMEEIVQQMLQDRINRVNQTLSRFTDSRLQPNARTSKDGYLPVLGAGQQVYISYTPVTNAEYAQFLSETGHKAPKNWTASNATTKFQYPVVNVTYYDAQAYCNWLSKKNSLATYRLPTEKEWELAAGHMPKDADFNNGENKGIMPVTTYAKTLSASGAIDMWGNVWEWTSTSKISSSGVKTMTVKGGAWNSPRMNCRTENRQESKNPASTYDNVGFRVIEIKKQIH